MIQLRAATNSLTALQHKRLQPAFREITRGDQTVVTTTDDDDVVLQTVFFQSFNNCKAPLRPGAPMMPPPGCVAEPHM